MSLRVEHQTNRANDDQTQVDSKKSPSESSKLEFENQMQFGVEIRNWANWIGYKPEYQQFDKNVKIVESEDMVKAEIDDKNVEPENQGIIEEFISWFKAGVEKFAKDIGKTFEFALASMIAMSIEQAMSKAYESMKLDQSLDSETEQIPLETRKAIANAAEKGPNELEEAVKTLVLQNPEMAPAIAAFATSEAVKANPALAGEVSAQIVRSAVQSNPQAAPQIAGAVAKAATENLPPEKAAEVLTGITKAASEVAPSQAPKVAAAVADVVVNKLPSDKAPETLEDIIKSVVRANPQTAPQIAGAIAKAAIATNPEAASQIAGEVTRAAVAANPEAAPQIAGEVTQAAVAANPEAAPQIAGEVTQAAVTANPEAAPQIAGEVTQAAVAANPQAAPQIAGEVTQAVVAANPEAAPQIAGEVTEAAVAANPEAAPQIAGEVTEAAVAANPQAAPQIGTEVINSATQTAPSATQKVKSEVTKAMAEATGNPESSMEQGVSGGVKNVEGQILSVEPAGVTKSKLQTAAEAASSVANMGGNVPPSTVNLESPTQSAATSGLDKRLNNILADIVKTVKELNIGDTFTTISFNDSTLRDVTVEISLNNGRLEVAFSTSNPDSQTLLQSNISALQNALQAGSGVSSVNVSVAAEPEESTEFAEGGGEGATSKSTDSKSDKKVSGRGSAASS